MLPRPERRRVVAVIGAAEPSPHLEATAERLGCALVDAGFRIATGGRGGIMAAASRGGRASDQWVEGSVVAVLPGTDASIATPCADIVIPTGMGHARNVILVAMADVVVAVGGGAGTLSELAMAWQHEKPIVCLDQGEGWSSRLAGERLDARHEQPLHRAQSVSEVVERALDLTNRSQPTA